MSVYTTAQPQLGQQPQQPYGLGQFGPQQPYGQHIPGMQQPFGQQMPQMQQSVLPQLVTDLALRCAASAVSAVVEQLRMDPQALFAVQAQGQIPAHLYSSVLTECARRIAPVLHLAISPIVQQMGQSTGQGQPGQFGQMPGQGQGLGQTTGQMFGQQGLGQQPWTASQIGAGFGI